MPVDDQEFPLSPTSLQLEVEAKHQMELDEARRLGMLQGGVFVAAIVARTCEVSAREALADLGVHCGDDLAGCAEFDIKRLIENRVQLPGLHAAWQKARREERK